MPVVDGFNSQTREYVYDESASFASQKEFWKAVYRTAVGQKLHELNLTQEAVGVIIQTAKTLDPDARYITTELAVEAVEAAYYRGRLNKFKKPAEPVAAAPAAETPAAVDRNGKKLGDSQLAWKAFAEWSRTASSEEIRKRKAIDPSFRKFVENSYRLEMNDEPVDAAPSFAIQPERTATGEDLRSELGQFAAAYKAAAAASVRRPIAGVYKLRVGSDEKIYTVQEFEILIRKAAEIGLL